MRGKDSLDLDLKSRSTTTSSLNIASQLYLELD